MGDQTSFEFLGERLTLRNVLVSLSERFGLKKEELIPGSETLPVRNNIKILVNGRNYSLLKNGLDAELIEGDEISLFPPMAGG